MFKWFKKIFKGKCTHTLEWERKHLFQGLNSFETEYVAHCKICDKGFSTEIGHYTNRKIRDYVVHCEQMIPRKELEKIKANSCLK